MSELDSFNNISLNFMNYIMKNEKTIYIIRRQNFIRGYFPIEGNDNFSMTIECDNNNEADAFIKNIFDEFEISPENTHSIHEKTEVFDEESYKITIALSNLKDSNIDISIYFKKI